MSSRRHWYLVWVLAFLPLAGWWLYGLLDVDEGFYGAVVAEMNRRGEWITPFYNGKPWFEKPILLYLLAKPCLAIFGEMVGPRLPSVITALGTYGVVAWFANRHFGAKIAQIAVLMLASCLLVIGTGRMMMTDLPLLVSLSAAFATFWESLVDRPKWRILTAVFLGFGVLAKGPVALILFVIVAGWTYWREPQLRPSFKGSWAVGTIALLVVISTWYVPAYLVNGQLFVQKFLIEQNIGRFTGGDAAHTLGGIQGLVFYIPLFLLGMFPWSLFLWKAWPRRKGEASELSEAPLMRYLATWGGAIFVFFTISGAKLPHYILPMFPPLVIVVAAYAVNKSSHVKRWFIAAGTSCVLMSAIANGVFIFWYAKSGQQEVHGIARYVRKVGGEVAMYQMGRRQKQLGTGKLKLQETSLPSVLMYLDRTAIDTDKLSEILQVKPPVWIITREDRIQPEDFITAQRANRRLFEVKPPVKQDHFKLYRVE